MGFDVLKWLHVSHTSPKVSRVYVSVIALRFVMFCKKQFCCCLPLVTRLATQLASGCMSLGFLYNFPVVFSFWRFGAEEFGLVSGFAFLYFPPLVSLPVSTGLSPFVSYLSLTSKILGREDSGFVSNLSPT